MTSIAFPRTYPRERESASPGFQTPVYAFRDMPDDSDLPRDEIGRDIVVLLADHPELRRHFGSVNPNAMPVEAKKTLLADMKEMLGIQPIRRRHLGYVGP